MKFLFILLVSLNSFGQSRYNDSAIKYINLLTRKTHEINSFNYFQKVPDILFDSLDVYYNKARYFDSLDMYNNPFLGNNNSFLHGYSKHEFIRPDSSGTIALKDYVKQNIDTLQDPHRYELDTSSYFGVVGYGGVVFNRNVNLKRKDTLLASTDSNLVRHPIAGYTIGGDTIWFYNGPQPSKPKAHPVKPILRRLKHTVIYHEVIPTNNDWSLDTLHKMQMPFTFSQFRGYVKINKNSTWVKCVGLCMQVDCVLGMYWDQKRKRMPDYVIIDGKSYRVDQYYQFKHKNRITGPLDNTFF